MVTVSKFRTVTETTPLNDVTVNVAVTVTTELVGRRHRQASITPSSPYFLRRTGRQALTCLRTIPTEPSSSSLPEGAEVGKGVVLAEFGHVYWVLVLQMVSSRSDVQGDGELPEHTCGDNSSKTARGSTGHPDGACVGAVLVSRWTPDADHRMLTLLSLLLSIGSKCV